MVIKVLSHPYLHEKVDSSIFLGYFLTSHAYRVYNKRLMTVEESIHVVFDETNPIEHNSMKNYAEEDDQNIILQKLESCPEKQSVDSAIQPVEILYQDDFPKEWRITRNLLCGQHYWTD